MLLKKAAEERIHNKHEAFCFEKEKQKNFISKSKS
jgi:hypothetical protein